MAWSVWPQYEAHVAALIDEPGVRSVCEIGGGRAPMVPLDEVAEKGLEYTVLDVSQEELDLAPDGYRTLAGTSATRRSPPAVRSST